MKNTLYKIFVSNQTEENEISYKTYRNTLTSYIRKLRRNDSFDRINKAKKDTKKLWQILNEITYNKHKPHNNITAILNSDGHLLTETTDIANCLNKYFVSIGNINDNTQPQRQFPQTLFLLNQSQRMKY